MKYIKPLFFFTIMIVTWYLASNFILSGCFVPGFVRKG